MPPTNYLAKEKHMKPVKWCLIGAAVGAGWWLLSGLFAFVLNVDIARAVFDVVNRPILNVLDPLVQSIVPADHVPDVILIIMLCYAVIGGILGVIAYGFFSLIKRRKAALVDSTDVMYGYW